MLVRILVLLQGGKRIRVRVSGEKRLVHPTVVLAHEEEVSSNPSDFRKNICTDRGIIAKKASSPGRLDRIVG